MVHLQKRLGVLLLAATWAIGTGAFEQTKVLAHVSVNLFEKNVNKVIARTVQLHEGDDLETTAKLFCASVGAKHDSCTTRIQEGLRSKFEKRIQKELIFDLQIKTPQGIKKPFFFFKSDTVSDAVVSFFSAYPEFPRDAASTNTLVRAVNTQLQLHQEAQRQAEAAAKEVISEEKDSSEDSSTALVDQSMFSYLIVGDHCKSFTDVHACKMELLYGPYQLSEDIAPVVEETSKMEAEKLNFFNHGHECSDEKSKASLEESLEDTASFADIVMYAAMMYAAAYSMTTMKKPTRMVEAEDASFVVGSIQSVDVKALSEVTVSEGNCRVERLISKKINKNEVEVHGKENCINNNFSSSSKKARRTARTPLRARQVHRSPVMPRI